jgi:glucose-specific phosphotransferase system IIA component
MKNVGNRAFSLLQRLGQALMVPVSVLPAAGLMLALGRILFDGENRDPHSLTYRLGKVLYASGLSVFEQLSLIFAIGVALGFTGNAGISGLAAVTGYFAFATVLKTFSEILELPNAINAGVLGGIGVGYLSSLLYNRFHQVQLPPVLGFFSGKRLVPILSVAASVLLALVFVVVWPPIQGGIRAFGEAVMASEFGPGIYASMKRLLIPVGLHHVFYPSFLYEFGEFTTAAGKVVHGDATRYFAGDPTAGRFMASEFPLMIYGLPAAALAMTLRARPDQRKMIGGVMLSAALTSIITGITEPIEFAYTFVAPLLYLAHAAIAFFVGWMTSFFDIHLGYTFSSSLIDLGIGYFNQKNISMLFLVVGPVTALIYFCTFYWAIGYFDFKTPGREAPEELPGSPQGSAVTVTPGLRAKALGVLAAIGGGTNIENLSACITRLRLVLKDSSRLDAAALKRLGASGVMKAGGGNVQIVFGVESDFLKSEIEELLRNGDSPRAQGIAAPLSGRLLSPSEIPDPTFRDGILGKTLAILPSSGEVLAPFDGEVVSLFRTRHAIGLVSTSGIELLIHVGIDTVKLNGEGFHAMVKEGDRVHRGQRLIEFDLPLIAKRAKSVITPIVITNPEAVNEVLCAGIGSTLKSGDILWNCT